MRLIIFLLTLAILSSVSYTTGLSLGEESQPIKRHKLTIGKLRQEMASQHIRIKENDRKQTGLLGELEHIDETLAAQQEEVLLLHDKISEQEAIIASKAAEIEAINDEKAALQVHLEKRLRAYYLMGKHGLLRIAFSRESIPELLIFNDSFQNLVTYDRAVFEEYRKRKEAIFQVKKSHELEKSIQENFLLRAEEEKKTLHYISEQKSQLLKKAKTEKGLYELALKEMKEAEDDLTARISKLEKIKEEKSKGFLLNKGKLDAPAEGALLTQFGGKNNAHSGKAESKGITIKIRDGAGILAVYAGKVIFTGYTRGYGRTVIIDHGYNYFTVTSRLEKIHVEKGDQVNQGQLIATSGDIATLFGKGLYFEIRKGGTAQDPMEWLRPDAFSTDRNTVQ